MQKLGLGTRKLTGPQAIQSITDALHIGYRHIDTAWIYGNEKEVGTAVAQSGISRSELTITTKVWFDYVPDYSKHDFVPEDFHYTQRRRRLDQTFEDLQTEYIDEVLLHRPTRAENDLYMLKNLHHLQQQGRIRHIGVANFPLWYLQEILSKIDFPLSTNQIELHPCLNDEKMQHFSQEKNLTLTAYSPLAHGKILSDSVLTAIAEKCQVSTAQVCIAWCLAQGWRVIPKASSRARLQENRDAQSLQLDAEDLAQISQLPKHYRYCNPPFAPRWDA